MMIYRLISKTTAGLRLIRWNMGLIGLLALYAGIIIADNPLSVPVLYTSVILFCIVSAGFAFNGYWDRERDRIDKPDRPLPAGLVSDRAALTLAIILGFLALLLSMVFELEFGLLTIILLFIVFLYSPMKRSILHPTWIITPLLTASPFAYAALLTDEYSKMLFPAILTFLFIFCREMLKDLQDLDTDKKFNIRSLPTVYGFQCSIMAALIANSGLLILIPVPYVLLGYSVYYLLIAFPAAILMLIFLIRLSRRYSAALLDATLAISTYNLVLGVLAFFVSSI